MNSVVVQPDGQLLFGGTQGSFAGNNAKIVIVKLDPGGSPDNNYDGDGVGLYNFINGQVSSEDIGLQADGKILSVGFGANSTSPGGRVLARFTNLVSAAGPLPVVLSHFNVEKKDQTALLQWTTSSEQNSSSFQILHAENGRDFRPVGDVKAAGNSSDAVSYQFVHTTPKTGWNYYWLLMKDLDGKSTLSEIKKINFNTSQSIEILPNPTDGHIVVKHPLNGVTGIRIFDTYGRMLIEKRTTNMNQTTLNLQSLAPGVYSISVIHDGVMTSLKLLKN